LVFEKQCWHIGSNVFCFCHFPCITQVDRATQDKQSAIVRAQGEAQSARLIGQAIQQNPSFITLRKIEVRRNSFTWLLT
jgi:hypothetical protein